MSHMKFDLLATSGRARRGRMTFHAAQWKPRLYARRHHGTVKGMLPRDIKEIGAEIILGNTFHLMLRPGTQVIKTLGDLRFHPMARTNPHRLRRLSSI